MLRRIKILLGGVFGLGMIFFVLIIGCYLVYWLLGDLIICLVGFMVLILAIDFISEEQISKYLKGLYSDWRKYK